MRQTDSRSFLLREVVACQFLKSCLFVIAILNLIVAVLDLLK